MLVPYDLIYVFIISLCLGSFSGMLVYRLNNDIPIFKRARSYCPSCDTELKWYNNIPLCSYIAQRGRCSYCDNKISIHYFLIEFITAFSLTIIYYWFNISIPYISVHMVADTFVAMFFVYLLIICAFTDLMTGYIFDKITITGTVIGIVLSLLPYTSMSIFDSAIGALAGYASLWLVGFVFYAWKGVHGIGGGDMKMLAMIGAFMGTSPLAYVVMCASIASIIVSGIILAISKEENKRLVEFKFGQYLAFSAIFFTLFDYRYFLSVI